MDITTCEICDECGQAADMVEILPAAELRWFRGARRAELETAIAEADGHGLPTGGYICRDCLPCAAG